jgi:acyl-CoA synthetase (AMP-forming)/AMP-acid ligase II
MPDSDIDEDAVIRHVRSELARYKCPVGVSFVDVLPRNASGKLLKRTIRKNLAS